MTQFSHPVSPDDLPEVSRLVAYVEQKAVDSEQTPIRADETPIVVGLLLQRLVWRSPNLEQVLQEVLDDLRFRE